MVTHGDVKPRNAILASLRGIVNKVRSGVLHLVFERTILVLAVIFGAGIAVILSYIYRQQSRIIEAQAVQHAAALSQALAEFRTLYTSEVVERARAGGVEVTHDFQDRDGAIPLPATLTMMLGNNLTATGTVGRTRLYSPFPFPWRLETGGLRDEFAREAWQHFQANPDEPFHRIEEIDGISALRYATADRMRASCVGCHNNHVDTPKNDWREGDVRGVLEVTVPLDAAVGQLRFGIGGTFALLVLLTALVLSGLVLVVRRNARIIFGLQKLGRYTLGEKIGEGGMGVVHKASHTMLRRPTAIKLLPPERTGEADVLRFEREVQLTSRLSHPNTIAIYDYGRTPDGVFYYAMEYLSGVTLTELIKKHGPQPEGRVIHILEQVCGSLAEAHGAGLVHRDIKPANIMLCTHGGMHDVVKVLDFGLVQEVDRSEDTDLGNARSITGTALYLAPEAIEADSPIDARCDLYAVGAVGYYLLTGKPVFSGLSMIEVFRHHLHTQPTPPSARVGLPIGQDLEDIILQCLAKDRDDRPPTAGDLRDSLTACDSAGTWDQAKARAWAKSRSEDGPSPESASAPPGRRRRTVEIDIKGRPEWG